MVMEVAKELKLPFLKVFQSTDPKDMNHQFKSPSKKFYINNKKWKFKEIKIFLLNKTKLFFYLKQHYCYFRVYFTDILLDFLGLEKGS